MDIMDKLRELFNKTSVAIIVGFILGLIIGLPILGWTVWPVKWVDTTPDTLREEYKTDYIRMMIDSFAISSDRATAEQIALQRWQALGSEAGKLFIQLNGDERINPLYYTEFSKIISIEAEDVTDIIPGEESGAVDIQPTDEFLKTAEAAIGIEEEEAQATPSGLFTKLGLVILIFFILIIIVGGSLAYLLFFRQKPVTNAPVNKKYSPIEETIAESFDEPFTEEEEYTEPNQAFPISQYITTYNLGDDLYDDSFSIDAPAPSGEFLGECGVGISDTLGSSDPKKVSAFEVWLFDKNDVQTVTKVLMTENAFNDAEARKRLEAKGELILLEPGLSIVLETTTLQLEARVVDFNYPQGTPPNSSIDRITLELSVWLKSQV